MNEWQEAEMGGYVNRLVNGGLGRWVGSGMGEWVSVKKKSRWIGRE